MLSLSVILTTDLNDKFMLLEMLVIYALVLFLLFAAYWQINSDIVFKPYFCWYVASNTIITQIAYSDGWKRKNRVNWSVMRKRTLPFIHRIIINICRIIITFTTLNGYNLFTSYLFLNSTNIELRMFLNLFFKNITLQNKANKLPKLKF